MLNWISSACIVQAGQAGPLYVNTMISLVLAQSSSISVLEWELVNPTQHKKN